MFTMKHCVLCVHTAPCVCLSVGLLLLLISLASAQQHVKYVLLAGVFELDPNGSSGPITQILWKKGGNKVAELDEASGAVDYYGILENRAQLNKATGRLVINNITKEDGGKYSVEVNSLTQENTYKVIVIKNVTKPSVVPQDCSPNSTSCLLVCEGGATDSGPVDYRWKKDDGWMNSRAMESGQDPAQLNITNDEEGKIATFFCEVKNPFSAAQSDPCYNPFKRPVGPPVGPPVGKIIAGVIITAILVAGLVLGVKRVGERRRERGKPVKEANEEQALNNH